MVNCKGHKYKTNMNSCGDYFGVCVYCDHTIHGNDVLYDMNYKEHMNDDSN